MRPLSSIPLTYFGYTVGRAVVDPELCELLPPELQWTLDIPKRDRRAHSGRPDIIAARLVSEPEFLPRCHPFCQTHGLVIRLSHLALRPQAVELLPHLAYPAERESAKALIRIALLGIPRVVFVNRSRVDCRLSNLREVSTPEGETDLPDTHPGEFYPPPHF